MCQRRQKSAIDTAWYGELKLSGNRIPKRSDRPMAISEYPEKSKYICKAYEMTPIHASTNPKLNDLESKTGATKLPIVSAKMTFLKRPAANQLSPKLKRGGCDSYFHPVSDIALHSFFVTNRTS